MTVGDKKRTFSTLDGMRGLAALMVVLRHSSMYFGNFEPTDSYLAVDLFFGLSGFVLVHAYGARFDRGMTARQFMTERAIRLYPLYAAGLALALLVEVGALRAGRPAAMSGGQIAAAAALETFMLPAPGGRFGELFPLNLPCWSLLLELAANLAMVMLWRRMSHRWLATVVATAGVGLVFAAASSGPLEGGFTWASLWIGVLRVVFSFSVGIIIYHQRNSVKLSLAPWLVLAIEAGLLLVRLPEAVRPWFDLSCIFVGFPALIAVAVQREPAVGARLFAFLGATSYAVYVLHHPMARLGHGMVLTFTGLEVSAFAPWSGVVFGCTLIILCWALDRIYDVPIRRWLRRRLVMPNRNNVAASWAVAAPPLVVPETDVVE